MKTAISLPDELFASADALAKRLGMSRSAVVAAALAEFVAKHRSSKVSERLDAVYGSGDAGVEPPLARVQRHVIRQSEW